VLQKDYATAMYGNHGADMESDVQRLLDVPEITPSIAQEANDLVGILLDELPGFQEPFAHIAPGPEYGSIVQHCISLTKKMFEFDYNFSQQYALDIARFAFYVDEFELAKSWTLHLKELIGIDPYTEYFATYQLHEFHKWLGDAEKSEELKTVAEAILEFYEDHRETFSENNPDDYWMCHSHFLLSCSKGQKRLGNYDTALDIVQMILDKVEESHDYTKLPTAYMEYGSNLELLQVNEAAEDGYRWAVDWSEKVGTAQQQAESYEALGMMQYKNKKPVEAIASIRTARERFNQLRDPDKVNELDSRIGAIQYFMSRQ
jgi:tetratricopeptide (TPR) repeat protein